MFFRLGKEAKASFRKNEVGEEEVLEDDFSVLPTDDIKRKIYVTMEDPSYSVTARIISFIDILLILASVFILCANLHRHTDKSVREAESRSSETLDEHDDIFFVLESCFGLWFTAVLIIRSTTCPSKQRFWTRFLNWIDLLALLPNYLEIVLHIVNQEMRWTPSSKMQPVQQAGYWISASLKIIRIFKLARYLHRMQILGRTIRKSLSELTTLLLIYIIGMLLFSTTVYFTEYSELQPEDEHKSFRSITNDFWWAMITMTTVGYGDMIPVGSVTRIVTGICTLCGITLSTLPISVLGANFRLVLEQETKKKQLEQFLGSRYTYLDSASMYHSKV